MKVAELREIAKKYNCEIEKVGKNGKMKKLTKTELCKELDNYFTTN